MGVYKIILPKEIDKLLDSMSKTIKIPADRLIEYFIEESLITQKHKRIAQECPVFFFRSTNKDSISLIINHCARLLGLIHLMNLNKFKKNEVF